VPLSGSGAGPSDAGTGETGVDAGADGGTDAVAPPASADNSKYHFENGTQSWSSSGAPIAGVAASTTRAFLGTSSLAVSFNGAAGSPTAFVRTPATPAGATISFRVWLPSGGAITSVQPYVLQGATGGWTWTGSYRAASSLTANAWNTITVTVPANAKTPLDQLGVEFTTNKTWSGTAYVDAVSW
jgi:hypothetical protein